MFAEKAQIAKEQASDSEVKRFAAIKFSPHLLQKTNAPNRVLFVFLYRGESNPERALGKSNAFFTLRLRRKRALISA